MSDKYFDVVIIGGGPAGLSAALYASRADLKTVVFEKKMVGGQMNITNDIANYPGAKSNTKTYELVQNMHEQCEDFGTNFICEKIVNIEVLDKEKIVHTKDNHYHAKAVIIATGNKERKLNAEGEEKLIGKGVSYCALCDGRFFSNYEVFVVGGGNSALEESLFLTKFARKVTIFNKSNNLRASNYYIAKAMENDKIEIVHNTEILKVNGDNKIDSITVRNNKTDEVMELGGKDEGYGLFVFIGREPNTKLFKDFLELNEKGYIITDRNMKTNIDGIYAAGDVREKEVRQVVTAVSDGAIAAVEAQKYIERL